MKTWMVRAFGIFSYLCFLASFLYFSAFVCGVVEPATRGGGGLGAVVIDLGLVALFGLSHSVMARQGFKRAVTRAIPAAAERSVFVLVASALLALLCYAWRPLPGGTLWAAGGTLAVVLRGVQVLGFGIALVSSFLIDHFELFGLRQAFGRAAPPLFVTPAFYRAVRHPMYLGFIVMLWAAPVMSMARLCLAAGLTAYILVGVRLEERDLARVHGAAYRRYREDVRALIPAPRARPSQRQTA